MKGRHEQSRGCDSMTVLILFNILLMIIFALFIFALMGLNGNGGQNWFNRGGLETQALQDPSMRGPSVLQTLKNEQPLSEQNGIDLNNPEQRSNVIYL